MEQPKTQGAAGDAAMAKAIEAVDAAKQAVEREERRLEEARAEVERHSRQIEETDPDDEKSFVRLVTVRDAARGRVEALEVRLRRAKGDLGKAEAILATARARTAAERLAFLNAEIRRRDDAITAKVIAFREEIAAEIPELRELVFEANALSYPDGSLRHTDRGLRWPLATRETVLRCMVAIPEDVLRAGIPARKS
jgi:hypothetical protein